MNVALSNRPHTEIGQSNNENNPYGDGLRKDDWDYPRIGNNQSIKGKLF